MKSGFIGLVGRANVGKSTLLNQILGEKVSITTSKPQTTRNTIRGIYNSLDDSGEVESQMVFLDTPGIHKGKSDLGRNLSRMAMSTFSEVDVLLFIVDSPYDKGPGDLYILEKLKEVKTPKILVINKIDEIGPQDYQRTYTYYDEQNVFSQIIGVSALKGTNVDVLIDILKNDLKEGNMYFDKDLVTDNPLRFMVSEIIREKLLMYLDEEIPHGVFVEIEEYREKKKITIISAVIYCEKKSHKGIIIGKKGAKLKGVGKDARLDMEALIGTKVLLNLWVKVQENWRNNQSQLNNFGFKV